MRSIILVIVATIVMVFGGVASILADTGNPYTLIFVAGCATYLLLPIAEHFDYKKDR